MKIIDKVINGKFLYWAVTTGLIEFGWNENKAAKNFRELNISFEFASNIFFNDGFVDVPDHAKPKKDGGGLSVSKGGYFSLFGRFGFGKGKSELSLSEKQTIENKENTVTYRPDYSKPPGPIDWEALDAITEEELQAIIDSDPDCAEPTDEEWARAIRDGRMS